MATRRDSGVGGRKSLGGGGGPGCPWGGEMRWGPLGRETTRLSGNPRPKIAQHRRKERLHLPNSPSTARSRSRPPRRGVRAAAPAGAEQGVGGGSPEGAVWVCCAAGPAAVASTRRPGPCGFAERHVNVSCMQLARRPHTGAGQRHGCGAPATAGVLGERRQGGCRRAALPNWGLGEALGARSILSS